MDVNGFFAVWPDVEARNRLNMLSVLLGFDSDSWEDYHITLMYDENNTPTETIDIPIKSYQCVMTNVALYNGYLVIEVDCPELHERHQQILSAGKQTKYPKYRPHITLSEFGSQDQVDFLLPYVKKDPKPLTFGNEFNVPANLGS